MGNEAQEKKPIILTWWPIIAVFIGMVATGSVDAYRLIQLETGAKTKVSKATYDIQLAETKKDVAENSAQIQIIKTRQNQQDDVRVRQEAIRDQIKETKEEVKALDEKMDEKFDDLKDFIRERSVPSG